MESVKTIIRITLITLMLLSLFGCSQKESSVVKAYETTDLEFVDENWGNDDHIYQYRLEITGRMNGADKDSTFVFLSNIKDITFEQAWKASGFSSMDDYFKREDARFVAMK